ncbi:Uncharacterised protein [Yersinia pekkanenii]|uniref:Uncharacterized protein n=1 Tax=Yersinia pekkanenii TaxID=1288385 RepID=A0A0T9PPV1_9GAMM|nr:Uncharacterised protein [Yersinia pekkanenii]CRY68623.1 Uncharacterised protein [Yersinia pekkanenii]
MVEAMIGLLRQNKIFTQTTRCSEGSRNDADFPTILLLSTPDVLLFPVLISRNNPLAIRFSPQLLESLGAQVFAFFIGSIGCEGSQNLIRM